MTMMAEFRAPAQAPDEQDEYEFPRATPLVEMTDAERAEYWRHEAKVQQRRREVAERRVRAAQAFIRRRIDEAAHA